MAWKYKITAIVDEVTTPEGLVELWRSNALSVSVNYFDDATPKEFPDFSHNFQFGRGTTQATAVSAIKTTGNNALATRRLVRDLQPEVNQTRAL